MKSRFVKSIFQNQDSGYCIFLYHTEDESIPGSAKNKYYKGNGCQFTAVGNNLPESDSVEVELHGSWVKNSYGTQFQVTNFEEILPQTEEGILGYLSSGMIKGIGPKTAKMIVAKYGTKTFEILDNHHVHFRPQGAGASSQRSE